MEYSTQTKIYSAKYNIDAKEVLLAYLVAAGADKADSYQALYKTKLNRDQAAEHVRELYRDKPGLKILTAALQNQRTTYANQANQAINDVNIEERERQGDDLKSRAGVLERLVRVTSGMSGKDELQGLVTLAKMQGFDKPDDGEDEEKRVYFLPWVSNCRACELMKLFKKQAEIKEPETGT